MKTKPSNKATKSLEKDHAKIVNGFDSSNVYHSGYTSIQWSNSKDSFVKFSLYNETPNSISSTDTSMASSL